MELKTESGYTIIHVKRKEEKISNNKTLENLKEVLFTLEDYIRAHYPSGERYTGRTDYLLTYDRLNYFLDTIMRF